MPLSDAQNAAVQAGFSPSTEWWEPVPLPDHAEVPEWCLDADTAYLFGPSAKYSNRPTLHLKVDREKEKWEPEWEWWPERRCYIAKHPDGRCKVHYHGEATLQDLKLWDEKEKRMVTKKVWATSQSEGYGGRHFHLKMKDGREVILRGPWHGGPPPGFVEVTYHLWPPENPKWFSRRVEFMKRRAPERFKWEKSWRLELGYFGWYITEDLFLRIVAKYLPHLRVARATRYGMTRLEPMIDGQLPKNFKE